MPKFSTAVPHPLGKQAARLALEGLLSRVSEKFAQQVSSLEQSWTGDTLTFALTTYGFKISGNVVVEDSEVRLDGDLPFAAAMFKGKIESSIKTEIEKALASAAKSDAEGTA
ncbi:MAG: polyhydroxyalkanoic acid system family protein [Planctomycetales bacterium]|nr:polyhydroxyalkanoic acid system family protein [Planctomycetales bacterium]